MSIKLNDVQVISEVQGNALVNVDGKFAQLDTSLLKGVAGEKGEKGDTGATGKNGIPGLRARELELRTNESSIEWRHSTNFEPIIDYYAANPQIPVSKLDTITKLSFVNVPTSAVYAQIKTVTGFGVNADGKVVANANPSIETMPEGTTFSYLEGFDPSKGASDISTVKEFVGNMGIQAAIDGFVAEFLPEQNVVDINRIILWVSFLDANQAELSQIQVGLLIKQDSASGTVGSDWTELMSLSNVTGLKGEKGDAGEAGKSVELTLADGYIKWRTADTYSEYTEGWKSLIAISDIVNQVLEQIKTVVEE